MPRKTKKTKTTSKLVQDLQKHFNKFIRERDKDLPCISCGQFKELQAGHYFPVKLFSSLRFDKDNVHGECAGCNGFDDSHLIGYGINLKNKIGEERYNALLERAENHKKMYRGKPPFKWQRHELLEQIEKYKELNKLK